MSNKAGKSTSYIFICPDRYWIRGLGMSHNRFARSGGAWRRCLCLLLLGSLFCVGCASRTTRKGSSISRATKVTTSATELNSRNQSLLRLYSAELENAADEIIVGSPSPIARRQALLWKAEAIPVLQTSLLNTDPLAAVIDTWAFLFQMSAHMEQPAVKDRLGGFRHIPSETMKRMEAEMEQLIIGAAPSADIEDLRRRVHAWADAHPIQTGL